MALIEWRYGPVALTGTKSHWFYPGLDFQDGDVLVIAPYTDQYGSGSPPWTVTLTATELDASGAVISAPTPIATYATGFDFQTADVGLTGTDVAVLWTSANGTYPASNAVDLNARILDTSTNTLSGPVTLLSDVGNLEQFRVSSKATGGSSAIVAYSTFNAATRAEQIQFRGFSADGTAIAGESGLLASFTTAGTYDSFGFGTLTPSTAATPSFIYLREVDGSAGHVGLGYQTIGVNGVATGVFTPIPIDYPVGSTQPQLITWVWDRLDPPAGGGNNLVTVSIIGDVNVDGAPEQSVDVHLTNTVSGANTDDLITALLPSTPTVTRLANGGFVVGYLDATGVELRAYDNSGDMVGSGTLPQQGLSTFNLESLPDGSIAVVYPVSGSSQLAEDVFTIQTGPIAYNIGSGRTTTGVALNASDQMTVEAGGIARGTVVGSGAGTLRVQSGGTTSGTVLNGGSEQVFAGGATQGTIINAAQSVMTGGTSNGSVINGGGTQSSSGTTTNTIINKGAYQFAGQGSQDVGATINSGGSQWLNGLAVGTIINGGDQLLGDGAVARSAVVNGGDQDVSIAGATAAGTTINGGQQSVENGASATRTTINNGGKLVVVSAGTVQGVTANAGSSLATFQGQVSDLVATAAALNVQSGVIQLSGVTATHLVSVGDANAAPILNLGATTLSATGAAQFTAEGPTAPLVTGASGGTLATSGTTSVASLVLGGAALWSNTGAATQTGTLQIGNGPGSSARLVNAFGGTYALVGDVSIGAGAGATPSLLNAGTLAKSSGTGISHIGVNTTDTGTLSVAGGNLRFDGAQNSFAGTYIGPGMIDYGVGSTAALGTIAMTKGACTTNFGTVNQSGTVTLSDASTIANNAGQRWTFLGDGGLALAAGSSTPLFTNNGTLAKTGGTGTTVVAINMTDRGTTTVASGTLAFRGHANAFSGAINGPGTVAFGGGGASTLGAGTVIATGGLSIADANSVVVLAENLSYAGRFSMQAGATLKLGGETLTLSGPSLMSGGTVAGAGTLLVTGTSEIGAQVGSGVVLSVDAGGHIQLDGSVSGGTLAFGSGKGSVKLMSGAALGDAISGFAAGDTIDFAGIAFSSADETVFTATATGGTLQIVDTAHGKAVLGSFSVTGSYAGGVFTLTRDGATGTTLNFQPTVPLRLAAGNVVTANIPGGNPLAVVDILNSDRSLNMEKSFTKQSDGTYQVHYSGGSAFAGKPYAAFDTSLTAAGVLQSQTVYDASGAATSKTTYNGDGSIYQQDAITYPASGQVSNYVASGSFFSGLSYSGFNSLVSSSGTLLEQELFQNDGSRTFTVPGSGLILHAAHNDSFTVTGHNETVVFGSPGFAHDTFSGYSAGDQFAFAHSVFASYADLSSHVTGTSSAVLTDSHGDTLTLAGVAPSSLTPAMFTFV